MLKGGAGEGLNKGGNIIRELKMQLQFFKSPFKDDKKKKQYCRVENNQKKTGKVKRN